MKWENTEQLSKVKALIEELQGITQVKIKDNLKRLLPQSGGGD